MQQDSAALFSVHPQFAQTARRSGRELIKKTLMIDEFRLVESRGLIGFSGRATCIEFTIIRDAHRT
jgi:hypothetical protein